MKKKILSVILCATLAFAMAIPAFADNSKSGSEPDNGNQPVVHSLGTYTLGEFYGWYMVYPDDFEPMNLNVYRSTPTPANMQKNTLWENDPGDSSTFLDQMFCVQRCGIDNRPRFYSRAGYNAEERIGYSFNMNTSNYGVMLYYDKGADYVDAEVDLLTRKYNENTCHCITLPNRNSRCVTVRNIANGSQVFWDLPSESNRANQLWCHS